MVQNLIKIKRKAAGTRDDISDPFAIWASEADRANFTADWCAFLRDLDVGKPIVSIRTLNVRKRSGSGNSSQGDRDGRSKKPRNSSEAAFDLSASPLVTQTWSRYEDRDYSNEIDGQFDKLANIVSTQIYNVPQPDWQMVMNLNEGLDTNNNTAPVLQEQNYGNDNLFCYSQGNRAAPKSFGEAPPSGSGPQYLTPQSCPPRFSDGHTSQVMDVSHSFGSITQPKLMAQPSIQEGGISQGGLGGDDLPGTRQERWFIPPPNAEIDLEKGTFKIGGMDLSQFLEIKKEGPFKLFRPLIFNQDVNTALKFSAVHSAPVLKEPPKPLLFDLMGASFIGAPKVGWEASDDRLVIRTNLSQDTKEALGLCGAKFTPPTAREMKLTLEGLSDADSIKFFETLNAPNLSKDELKQLGGPFEGIMSPLSTEVCEADFRRRKELSALVGTRSAVELASSLCSYEALEKFNLSTEAHVHMTHLSKALEAAQRYLSPTLAKAAENFSKQRKYMHMTATSRIANESVKRSVRELEVYSPGLWPEDSREPLVDAARAALADNTWKVVSRGHQSVGGQKPSKVSPYAVKPQQNFRAQGKTHQNFRAQGNIEVRLQFPSGRNQY